ncbi:TetR/AcrR family transcriptional regulator [Aggregatibacter actinomycetemcomitans]|uniref:TetR/AcrR family transcriptional regulator n=1 Tax=Aggregatibacter actinomycetemcomitans TaxID=714 RepID=UPI0002E1D537|nr:TetR/AcrR family transcriptional regulator [Aggregatibacter actinomycetemcomitans]
MNNQDVRVLRTDRLIRDAFLTFLAEKGFEAMTVQDILDLTKINRSTFYKHFANIPFISISPIKTPWRKCWWKSSKPWWRND